MTQPSMPPSGARPRVVMEGIRKAYGTIQALDGVDLRLAAGEVLGLVGDNAAGKSTLTKILAGAEVPDRGRILGMTFLDRAKMHRDARRILLDLHIRVPSTRLKVLSLSGGQRQSVAIGRAVSFDPAVLIMDEPTAALAVAEVRAVLRLINDIKRRGVSVILITHRLQDLFEVCDRIMVLYEGRKLAERAVGETGLEDLVRLIMGQTSRTAAESEGGL